MRLKIIAGNLIAVLLLGTISYLTVGGDIEDALSAQVRGRIAGEQQLLERSLRLTAIDFVENVKRRARDPDVTGVFNALDEEGRRTRAYEAAERSSAWFGDPARGSRGRPDIVVLTDDAGIVLARNADRNRMFGTALARSLPAVAATLADGEARHDAWQKDDEGKMLELAVAAVRDQDGTRRGVLVVGYDLSNGFAAEEGKLLGGREVAFLTTDKVYSSSLDESAAKQLKAFAFGEAKSATMSAFAGTVSSVLEAQLAGHEYVGVMAPLPAVSSAKVAYAILADRSEAIAPLASSTRIILVLMVVFGLLVLAYGFMLGNSIVKPVEEMEEGILSVINGNTNLRLPTSNKDFGGLAYRINQVLNVMTGVSEADDEDDQGRVSHVHQEVWKDSAFAEGAGGSVQAAAASSVKAPDAIDDPALAARLMAEPEDAYMKRVFKEYVSAKKETGESVPMTEDRFAARLKGNGEAAAKKHGVKAVRFQVVKEGGQVNLQAVLIR